MPYKLVEVKTMDDKKLEDRLALLKSSYDRLPSTIDSDDILKK